MQITITEALSEINLIKKKIEKKQQDILANVIRWDHVKDPFEAQGGSEKYLSAEIQSLRDLRSRWVRIRAQIADANGKNTITIGDQTKTINEWLNWKREVASGEVQFSTSVYQTVKKNIDHQMNNPKVTKDESGTIKILNLIPNVDYATFLKESERLNDALETLDGKLSLKNATIMIEV